MRPVTIALAVLSGLGLGACDGTHDDLGLTTSSTTTGSGGAGGGTGAGAGGAPSIVEPDGPTRWTFVNGVVDRDQIALCFLKSPADAADAASPWPTDGIGFARAASIDLPGAPVPADSDLELVLLAGAIEDVGALDCRALADDPTAVPGLDVLSLGVLPAETATRPRSLLFVPNGCLGGLDHEDANDDLVCGLGYAPDLPTPGLAVAPISRVKNPERVGLQAVHASPTGPLDVYVTPVFDGAAPSLMASGVVSGQAAPFPPFAPFSIADLGGGTGPRLTTHLAGMAMPLDDATFGDALGRGGLVTADVANGKNVAFVGVGAQPGLAVGAWWHAFTWVAVRPD
jgi:hypothetical protein